VAVSAALVMLPKVTSPGEFMAMAWPPVAAVLAGSLLWLTVNTGALALLLGNRPMAYLGMISFGLYIYHLWAWELGVSALRWLGLDASQPARTGTALAAAIAISTLSYYGLERPFLRLKRRFESVPTR
jgi:peptidoglycan/LPS O-acetylase OafA/YrhL